MDILNISSANFEHFCIKRPYSIYLIISWGFKGAVVGMKPTQIVGLQKTNNIYRHWKWGMYGDMLQWDLTSNGHTMECSGILLSIIVFKHYFFKTGTWVQL